MLSPWGRQQGDSAAQMETCEGAVLRDRSTELVTASAPCQQPGKEPSRPIALWRPSSAPQPPTGCELPSGMVSLFSAVSFSF